MATNLVDHPSSRRAAAVQIYDRYLQAFMEAARRDTIGDTIGNRPARSAPITGAQVIEMQRSRSQRQGMPAPLHYEIVLL